MYVYRSASKKYIYIHTYIHKYYNIYSKTLNDFNRPVVIVYSNKVLLNA